MMEIKIELDEEQGILVDDLEPGQFFILQPPGRESSPRICLLQRHNPILTLLWIDSDSRAPAQR